MDFLIHPDRDAKLNLNGIYVVLLPKLYITQWGVHQCDSKLFWDAQYFGT